MTTPPPEGYGPPPGQQPPQPGYGPPPGWAPPRGTNTMAIIGLVMIFVFTPAALVFGIIARKQIKQTGEQGDGMALASIICGAISVALVALVFVFVVLAVAVSGY